MKEKLIAVITGVIVLIALSSARNTGKQDTVNGENNNDSVKIPKALVLLHHRCFNCHNPNLETENRLAPPMFKIREHYYEEGKTNRKDFIHAISAYVSNPSEENSIMPGAVRKFGVMPKMIFSNEEIEDIAGYLYDNDVASDSWYTMWEKIKNKMPALPASVTYESRAREYAAATKTELGKNLLKAINQQGTEGAISFCNTRALPLTDSMSVLYNASIKRVSDKTRNAKNKADKIEMEIISSYQQKLKMKEAIVPVTKENDDFFVGYYPIETNKMCLQCHGNPENEIQKGTMSVLKKLYPYDKAVGYGENQLRGIWVVKINKAK